MEKKLHPAPKRHREFKVFKERRGTGQTGTSNRRTGKNVKLRTGDF